MPGLNSENFRHMVLPVIALSVIPAGIVTRTVRGAVAELLNQEFVEALRSKGMSEARIVRHVAKNAAPQVLAVMGLQMGYLLGGSILIETVFAWPGIGRLTYEAVIYRDFPLLQAVIILKSILILSIKNFNRNFPIELLQSPQSIRRQVSKSL